MAEAPEQNEIQDTSAGDSRRRDPIDQDRPRSAATDELDVPWFKDRAPSNEEDQQAARLLLEREAREAAETKRRASLQANVAQDYLVVGSNFYFKDRPGLLAFRDAGKKLVTSLNNEQIAFSMAAMAEAKGWSSLAVKGHQDFRREIWFEASLRGIAVRGYTPTEHDLTALDRRRERTQRSVIQRSSDPKHSAKHPHALGAPVDYRKKEQATPTYVGTLLEHGPAPYRNQPGEATNYFLTLATDEGKKRLWGRDLHRAVRASGARVGETVTVEHHGKRPVTVSTRVRDEQGRVVGQRLLETLRNQWTVQKTDGQRIVEAVAAAVIAHKVQNSTVAAAVLASVQRRSDDLARQGRVPAVMVYDQKAPPSREPSIAHAPLEHSARSR
jgi:putative DNA primase/helicase